jgi:hypothetical protein
MTVSGARLVASAAAIAVVAAIAAVVVAPSAGATDVSTEAQLRNAFTNDAQVDLLNDITLTDCQSGPLNRPSGDPVTLDGHGFTITQTCSDNLIDDPLAGTDVTLQNVTLTGGRENDDGGAVDMNGGNLTVINSTLTGNCAADSAGAIENEDGDIIIIASTLNGNFAEDQGGATRSKRGNTTIINSTVTENAQRNLGAVDSGQGNDVASLTLIYDTIVDNSVIGDLDCPVDEPLSTEEDVDDDADVGPQQFNPANVNAEDAFTSFGTVIALPNNGPNCDFPNTTSLGWNYSDDDELDNSCAFDGEGDIPNGGDPLLGPLDANGGPTLTRLPATGSPLLEQIPPEQCPGPDDASEGVDQRALPRPGFELCDIGSVELQPEPPPPVPAPLDIEPTFTG